MPLTQNPKDRVTVSFLLPSDTYDKLKERLPNHGEISLFFRTVIKMWLDGKLNVSREQSF